MTTRSRTSLPAAVPALLASMAVAAASLVALAPLAAANDVDCPTASTSLTQDGSVYLVTSAADLQLIKEDSTKAPRTADYRQTANINMQQGGSDCTWDRGISGIFSGIYDGQGFTVQGVNITTALGRYETGLFETVTGTIRNLGFSGTVFSGNSNSTWTKVGGLVAQLDGGTIEDSFATGDVTSQYSTSTSSATGGLVGYARDGAIIRKSYATGDVSATERAGGLLGFSQNTSPDVQITESYASGNVTVTEDNAGGLVGNLNNATVTKSFATGNVVANGSTTTLGTVVHVAGFAGSVANSTIEDSYATGGISGGNDQVGGFGGDVGSGLGNTELTRVYSLSLGGISPMTSYRDTGALLGVRGSEAPVGNVVDSFFNNQTSQFGDSQAVGNGSDDGIKGRSTAQLKDLATFTDNSTGWDWNATVSTSIAQGYDATYTWGICSAVNDGYPFLTSFYSSDPCTSGGGGDSTTSAQPTYTFTFLTSGGGKCLPDVTVRRFEKFTLPPSSVACTPLGTGMAGWSIPGQDWAFTPGRVVTVVDSQVFTAVAREPRIDITYDANVGMEGECVREGANVTVQADRMEAVSTPRTGDSALLATTTPCSPPGFELIGWTDANTPDGSGQAQAGAQTYEPGAAVPDQWNLDGPNPVNDMRLYALWGRTAG